VANLDPEETEDDEPPLAQQDEYTATALKLKALEKTKAHLNAQLATKKRAVDQAKKLTEAKRKLAEMQAEVEKLQKACEDTQQPHTHMPPHFSAEVSHQADASKVNSSRDRWMVGLLSHEGSSSPEGRPKVD